MSNPRVYRVLFHNQGKIYELHARHVSQSTMYAFVEVGDLIFGERSAVLVDPSEEKLKAEFAGVQRTYIPLQALIRIDEVEKEGPNRILAADGAAPNVMPFAPPAGPKSK